MRSSLRRFVVYLKPYGGLLLVASLAGILRYLIPLALPWGIKIIVDDILGAASNVERTAQIHRMALGLLACYGIWTVVSYARMFLTGFVGNRVIFDLRERLFAHVQGLSLGFFERHKVGAIVSRLIHDIQVAQQLVTQGVTNILMDLTSVFVIAWIMWRLNPPLTLVALALVPIYGIASRFFSVRIRKNSYQTQGRTEEIAGYLHEKISGAQVVHAFSQEGREKKTFWGLCQNHLQATLRHVRLQAVGLTLTGLLAGIAPVLVIWYGALSVAAGNLSVGQLMAFYAYVGLLYAPVSRLTELNVTIANSLAAIDRIFEVMDRVPEVKEKPDPVKLTRARGKITFSHVTFRYDREVDVLKQVSFEVRPGECVLLVGPSGSGKSTVAKLLMRFYDVPSGAVLLDDINLRDLSLVSLRHAIGFVPQEPVLFSGTILENILYGCPQASREEALRAARTADAHDFIMGLPEQYETQVGERSVRLSSGERQRVAIARALLKNPPILLLDEPTSAVDDVSALIIEENLRELRKGRTTLIISHRPLGPELIGRVLEFSDAHIREVPFPARFAPTRH